MTRKKVRNLIVCPCQSIFLNAISLSLSPLLFSLAAFCRKLSLFKSITVGGIFEKYFSALTDKTENKPHKFDLRNDTTVYLCPKADRVTLVYEVNFSDKVDKVVAKVMHCLDFLFWSRV